MRGKGLLTMRKIGDEAIRFARPATPLAISIETDRAEIVRGVANFLLWLFATPIRRDLPASCPFGPTCPPPVILDICSRRRNRPRGHPCGSDHFVGATLCRVIRQNHSRAYILRRQATRFAI